MFHLAGFCLEELGLGFVHLNSPITGFWFENFKGKKHYIDIDITDPETFVSRNTPHGIFVEVKWIYKDITKVPRGRLFLRRRIEGIEKDCMKLQGHVENNRCKIAYMCIIDDEHYISDEQLRSLERKCPAVKFLILKPKTLTPSG